MYFFYYFPVGVDVATRRRPWVTWIIGIVCVTLFLLYKYKPYGSWYNLAFLIYQPSAPSLATAVTHVFLHAGWMHLAGNMVYLALFGPPLEARLGPLRYYVVFIVSAMFGAFLHTALTASFAPQYLGYGVVGASGAASGLLGAYLVRLYFSRVRIAWWIFMPLQGVNRTGRSYVPAVIAIVLWFALQGVRAVMQYGAGGAAIAYGEHVGGFLAGAALALAMKTFPEGRAERRLAAARRHFERAEWFGAQAEYIEYLARRPGDGAAHGELARAYICGGDRARARESYGEAIRLAFESGERGRAEDLFAEASRQVPRFTVLERLHLDLACGMERSLKYGAALAAYEQYLWRYPGSPEAPFVLLRMAGIHERRFDRPDEARACYRRLVEEYAEDRWVDYARSRLAAFAEAAPGSPATA